MEQRATRLLARAAGLGTDTTVLMHGSVALAFHGANSASLGAGHELRLHQHRARNRSGVRRCGRSRGIRQSSRGRFGCSRRGRRRQPHPGTHRNSRRIGRYTHSRPQRMPRSAMCREDAEDACEQSADVSHHSLPFQIGFCVDASSGVSRTARCGWRPGIGLNPEDDRHGFDESIGAAHECQSRRSAKPRQRHREQLCIDPAAGVLRAARRSLDRLRRSVKWASAASRAINSSRKSRSSQVRAP
jgi:hypothetical protein